MWDFWKTVKTNSCIVPVLSLLAWVGSLIIMILILADTDTAVENSRGAVNVELYRSFYLIWIGYPLVSLFGWGTRSHPACMKQDHYNGSARVAQLAQGRLLRAAGHHAKGAFAMWTAYAAFGMKFFVDWRAARAPGRHEKPR